MLYLKTKKFVLSIIKIIMIEQTIFFLHSNLKSQISLTKFLVERFQEEKTY